MLEVDTQLIDFLFGTISFVFINECNSVFDVSVLSFKLINPFEIKKLPNNYSAIINQNIIYVIHSVFSMVLSIYY